METIVVVGGNKSTAEALQTVGADVQVLYHDTRVKTKQGQRKFETMIKKANRIVLMVDACSHQGMWGARTAAKQQGIPIYYNRGLGINAFVQSDSKYLFS